MKNLAAIIVTIASALTLNAQEAINWANFGRYAAENDTIIAHATYPEVVLMGNSITEGWPVQRPQFFTPETGIVGRGISGQTSYQMLVRFRSDVVDLKPKIVVINAGTNDIALNSGAYDENHTLANIITMAEIAKANGITPVLSTVLPAGGFSWRLEVTNAMEQIQSLNGRIKEYAVENGIYFVDYFTPLVNSDHTAMSPGFASDNPGVHPNGDGYDVMQVVLMDVLKQLK